MEKLTADGGVLKKVLRPGAGVCVPEGAVVRAHYNGYLEYCDEPYDSSRLRNSQLQFTLGNGEREREGGREGGRGKDILRSIKVRGK